MDKIASEEDLEALRALPESERRLNDALRGVLKEIALTGVLRYNWSLIQPLISILLKEVLEDFQAEALSEIGPARPLLEDETVQQVHDRFLSYLKDFRNTPWTIQRLCEVLLEPHKQYSRLHKVVMAIEKLLLVTGEIPLDPNPPPPPRLSSLGPVNENPPPVNILGMPPQDGDRKRLRADEDGGNIAAAALAIRGEAPAAPSQQGQQQQQQAQQAPDAPMDIDIPQADTGSEVPQRAGQVSAGLPNGQPPHDPTP